MKEKLKTYLLSLFSEAETEIILPYFEERELKANDIFIHANQPVTEVAFLVEGIFKAVHFITPIKYHVHYFIFEGHFFAEADGFFQQKPAKLSMVAATKCKVMVISLENLEQLMANMPNVELTKSKLGEQELYTIDEMRALPKMGTPLQCYQLFEGKYPTVINLISVKDMALYLGITPNYLSTLRNEAVKKA
jgi:CRP-like cAMP-binding protein